MASKILQRRGARRPFRGDAGLVLSPRWQLWIAENLLRGVAQESLIAGLVDDGVPASRAATEVRTLAASPAIAAGLAVARTARQLELVAAIDRHVRALSAAPREVERRAAPSAEELFERYLCGSTPVVLTDLLTAWPALTRWSPAYFKERVGDASIVITSGRAADPDYDRNYREHLETTTMASFADRVVAAGESNDVYMVSNNRNLEDASLRLLLDDVVLPTDYLDPDRLQGCVSLWFGPKGTLTPLHHDTTSVLFCQIVGEKRFRLIPPQETSLLPGARDYYASIADAREGAAIKEVVVSAGEALFLPVGWWHEVLSLSVSISLSFTNFRRPNRFDWYTPGAP
ncbi:MAG: cupin-like domain-containing protein [Byssovorax sp.]